MTWPGSCEKQIDLFRLRQYEFVPLKVNTSGLAFDLEVSLKQSRYHPPRAGYSALVAEFFEVLESDRNVLDEMHAVDLLADHLWQVPEVLHRDCVVFKVVVSNMLAGR